MKQLINGKIVIFPKFASRPPDVSSYITQMDACETKLSIKWFLHDLFGKDKERHFGLELIN